MPNQLAADWVEGLARLGYGAKAVLYATVALLAGQAALGLGGRTTDTNGAMTAIAGAPFGRILLSLCALGLVGYALWRVIAAVTDAERRGRDLKGLALRLSFVARAIVHLVLAWTAVRIVTGRSPVSQTRADELGRFGGWLLVAIGVGVGSYGIYQLYRAFNAKLSRQIDHAEMVREAGTWVYVVARFGIAARGIVFCMIGFLTVRAATGGGEAGETHGLRASLRILAELGQVPLGLMAAGLLAYAFYEVLNVRYREIRP
jgi:Domain of Unknown Function (DUF1206)